MNRGAFMRRNMAVHAAAATDFSLRAPRRRPAIAAREMSALHSRSVLQLIGAAFCWSLAGVLIKHVGDTWPGLAVAGARGAIAAVFLLLTCRGLRFPFSRIQIVTALLYAACTILFCWATTLTTAANAILIQYTAPVWVALLGARFLGERATRLDWIAIAVTIAGMAIFLGDGLASGHLGGDFLALLSGIGFGATVVALRRQKDGSPVESVILGNVIAFVICLPWILRAPPLPGDGWVAILLLGTVQLGLSYWLYTRAIRHVTALEGVIIPIIEPLLNPVWVLLFVGEAPSGLALIGGAVVITGVTLRSLLASRGRS